MRWLWLSVIFAASINAQEPCSNAATYAPCDIVFELSAAEASAHPNPYLTVNIQAEVKSPRFKTFLMFAFWDGGNRMVLRFTPTDPGQWEWRLTSNIERFNGKANQVAVTDSGHPGFIIPANVHHWRYTEGLKPHLWMGDVLPQFATMDRAEFERHVAARAEQKFNHLRGNLLNAAAYAGADRPNPAYFQELDARVRLMNSNGITWDAVIAPDVESLLKLFPEWRQRERFLKYIVARYAPMDLTWQGIQNFDAVVDGRKLLKEVYALIQKFDGYQHPRTAAGMVTSSAVAGDGWMNILTYQTPEPAVGAIEHQLYGIPQVSIFADRVTDAAEVRHRLWNATMNGQYPVFNGAGDAKIMSVWFDLLSRTRFWELEPYFDVDGGRAVALEDVEYIVYVEKPSQPVELTIEKHSYDVSWIDPATGEVRKEKKDFKGERFVAEPPSRDHDWILHLERTGRKEGMLRSYRFESRPIILQEVEMAAAKVPFELVAPAAEDLKVGSKPKFEIKLRRESRATRAMLYLLTGEVVADGQGSRVAGTGPSGTLSLPAPMATKFPGVLNIHVVGRNANGKVYALDKLYRLTQ